MADRVAGALRQPFRDQIAAFRLRLGNLVPTRRWDEISGAAHDRAFMVAGATKADLLADLAEAVEKSISQGTGLEEFRRDFREIVTRRGWHGWTGEGTKAGEAWRTRVIYRTNAATTYAAGRHAQLTEGGFAWWVYRHGGSLEPRIIHLGWDGLVLAPDHRFWASHYPPNGWGCSCFVIGARSLAGARRVGGDPGKPLPPGWDATDPRTGAPPGIDRGWDHAPGASATRAILALRDKLDFLPERPSIDLIQSWLALPAFAEWLAAPNGAWPLVRLSATDAKRIGAKRRVADLSADTAVKQRREHPEITAVDYARAQDTISQADQVIRDGATALVYVRQLPATESQGGFVLVVKATRTGEGLFITSFRRLSRDEAARDRELRRLMRKGG
ncbi:virion morphogenesis protein [Maritimibacter sp. 55A14]|uniref:phage head morphogenesis protein n=1 Tax=Maritimibacter sp. 55A14 TaxID=2174844 RepID=UPI000D620C2E|nr:phage minor head protein [Maritimibacter sp. 55A14]PWE29973.1 virion morphogenesis protein [Maritimibacter sp. 55A14]